MQCTILYHSTVLYHTVPYHTVPAHVELEPLVGGLPHLLPLLHLLQGGGGPGGGARGGTCTGYVDVGDNIILTIYA